ncbi:acetate--CoA ligase family protein [Microtetraspora niveoalba]|uniref:acetate--CoA ligase family protein n=1 Tax=Microtetraspora niveoalba TaxID=46175 RepID=UPI00082CE394|nr:acetate--CoA ligase family protein [Microtetraspora niveoalba]
MEVFRDPRSVAVVGASADRAKWGYWLARGALAGAHRRDVHLVGRPGAVVEGVPCLPSLRDLPRPPELVALCVPPHAVPEVVDEALDLGARGFVGITAGLDQALGEGTERRLAGRIAAAGARLLGPNCLGLYDAVTELELAWGAFSPGGLAIVSQSGQLGLALGTLAAEAGLGVSRFVSLGNQADVTAAEALADLAGHTRTRVVALYAEDFGDGRALVETFSALRTAGKPVIVLTVGGSEASRVAARSHTGSLTSAAEVVDAACRAGGAIRVASPGRLVDLAQALAAPAPPRGRRVAVVSDGGGQGALGADVAEAEGLRVVPFSEGLAEHLAGLLTPAAATANPVDLAGAGERDLTCYAQVIEAIAESGQVDAVLLTGYFGAWGGDNPALDGPEVEVAGRIAAVARRIAVHVDTMGRGTEALAALREERVPVYPRVDGAAWALAQAAALGAPRGTPAAPGLPPERVEAGGGGGAPGRGYWAARELLAAYGAPFPPGRLIDSDPNGDADDGRMGGACTDARPRGHTDRDRAVATLGGADGLRAPYVLKADWLEHKSEAGGVVVGIPDAEALRRAHEEMAGRLGPGRYVVEEMDTREHVVEILVGGRRDPAFGPVVVVGFGGTEVELWRDTVTELAPVTTETALDMLRSLRCHPLLAGWRGRPPLAVEPLAELVVTVSRLLAERPDVAEIEINPVRVGTGGVLAVDALITSRDRPGERPE